MICWGWCRKSPISPFIMFGKKRQRDLVMPVLCAKQFVGNEPFAVLLGDDIIDAQVPCLKKMMDVYEDCPGTILGCPGGTSE